MAPNPDARFPSWLDEKEHERFGNFLSVLPREINFDSQKWAEWHKVPQCETCLPAEAQLTSFQ